MVKKEGLTKMRNEKVLIGGKEADANIPDSLIKENCPTCKKLHFTSKDLSGKDCMNCVRKRLKKKGMLFKVH